MIGYRMNCGGRGLPFSRRIETADGDQEGLGLTIVEAMGCGCATIASDLPAIRDVIKSEETGILVPPAAADELAEAICRLLDDEDLVRQLASAGRDSVVDRFGLAAGDRRLRAIISIDRRLTGSSA